MNTCGTCKYRGKPAENEYGDEILEPTTYFICDRIKQDYRWEYKQGQRALVVDGSGYYAALCVEADFGCTEWEQA